MAVGPSATTAILLLLGFTLGSIVTGVFLSSRLGGDPANEQRIHLGLGGTDEYCRRVHILEGLRRREIEGSSSTLKTTHDKESKNDETPTTRVSHHPPNRLVAYLKEHTRVQNERLREGRPEHVVVMQCSQTETRTCGGWADRLKGIIDVYALALLTNSTFVVNADQGGQNISHFYESELRYDMRDWEALLADTKRPPARQVNCVNQDCLKCMMARISSPTGRNAVTTYFRANMDCANFIVRHPHLVERARAVGIFDTLAWRAKLYEHLFSPNARLRAAIRGVLVDGGFLPPHTSHFRRVDEAFHAAFPRTAAQMRIGHGVLHNGTFRVNIPQDPSYMGNKKELVQHIEDLRACINQVESVVGTRAVADSTPPASKPSSFLFLSADMDLALSEMAKFFSQQDSWRPIVSNGVGNLTHINYLAARQSPESMAALGIETSYLRLFTDFEIFRHAKTVYAANSGFTLYAYMVRHHPEMLVVETFNQRCNWPWSKRSIFGE